MNTSPTASHACDLVAQITQGDPEKAKTLIEFCALTDSSTPTGAAIRLKALAFAYAQTEAGQRGLEAMMEAAMLISVSASHVLTLTSTA